MSTTRPSNPSSRSVSAALAPARLAPTITKVWVMRALASTDGLVLPHNWQATNRDVRNRAREAQIQTMAQRTSHPAGVDRDLVVVVAWRLRRLERAGFESGLAGAFAADCRTDLHALLELVDRGCPPSL